VVVVVEGDLVYEEVWVGWGVMVGWMGGNCRKFLWLLDCVLGDSLDVKVARKGLSLSMFIFMFVLREMMVFRHR
jgi:hypothetical protein